MKHLWEVDHHYHCSQSNYFARGDDQPFSDHKSWGEFVAEEGSSDPDLNLLFRWDWHEGADRELGEYNGDDYYRHARLLLFFMGQGKGLYRWAEVQVCRADEPAIIEFLKPRLAHLISLWEPLTINPADRL